MKYGFRGWRLIYAQTMIQIYDLNCGLLGAMQKDPRPPSIVHCLALRDGERIILIDAGFGTDEMRRPFETLGKKSVEFWGIQIDEKLPAVVQLRKLGMNPDNVTDIVLTHGDVDHAGGLADFPNALVHISFEEYHEITNGNFRYAARQFAHEPKMHAYPSSPEKWIGMESRPLDLGISARISLIPLFGHTLGHCGVAIETPSGWLLHAGDSYYRRVEIESPEHPFSEVPPRFAADNGARLTAVSALRQLWKNEPGVRFFSSHDATEYAGLEV